MSFFNVDKNEYMAAIDGVLLKGLLKEGSPFDKIVNDSVGSLYSVKMKLK